MDRKQKHAAYMREYLRKNPEQREKNLKRAAQWKKDHPEETKAQERERYLAQREQRLATARKRYAEKREEIKRYSRDKERKRKLWAVGVLGGKCQRCDCDHPAALDFHHLEPERKTNTLSEMLGRPKMYPDDVILAELEHCELICKNCHAVEHYGDEG